MNKFLVFPFLLLTTLVFGQTSAITTLTAIICDQKVNLDQKDKRSHATTIDLKVPSKFWEQYERIDAVFISTWIGIGDAGRTAYQKDSLALGDIKIAPILHYVEKDPRTFTRPETHNKFGIEQVFMVGENSEKCIKKYRKKGIKPRGFY